MSEQTDFEISHQVPYYECDASGHLTIGMLFRLLILVSEEHSTAQKVGPDRVKALGGGWVIIDYDGTINRLPKRGETAVFGTRVAAYNRSFVVRDFWVKDAAGTVQVKVKGLFAFMNLTSRKIATIPTALSEPFQLPESRRLPKVARPTAQAVDDQWQASDYRVRFFDIDLNNHVNNACYFDWLLDPLGSDFLLYHRLVGLKIKYDHEVRAGATVTSTFRREGAVTYHQVQSQDGVAAEAEFTWEEC